MLWVLVTSRYFDLVIVNKAASDVLKMSSDDQEQKLNKIPLAMAPIFRLKIRLMTRIHCQN